MENKECKNCGLLQSTVTGTSYPCVKTNKEHDFGEENKDPKGWEKVWDNQLKEVEDIYYGDGDGYGGLKVYLNSNKNKLFDIEPYPETYFELDPEKVKDFIHQVEQEAYNRGRIDLATEIANS